MAAPGHTTPLRAATFQNLQLNAGIFIANADYSSIANATALKTAIENLVAGTSSALGTGAKLLGATRGGGSFTVTRELRQPDVDGRRYGFKGDTFVDSVDAQLSTTLVEITLDAFKTAFSAYTATGSSPKQTLKLNTAIATTDYLTNVCWIGDLSDGKLVLICLKNTINEADISLTFSDKGEGTIPVEFHAKQAGVNDYDTAPFEIVYFTPAT
jgi:hypothetical protein